MNSELVSFIQAYQEDVLRYCFFLTRNESHSRDLAQDVFLRFLTKKRLDLNHPKAFLFQIAKNLFLDEKRREKYHQKFLDTGIKAESIDFPDLEVWRVLFTLDPADQEVLLLIDREEMSISEAAEVLNISEAAVKSRLFRARENYKNLWNK